MTAAQARGGDPPADRSAGRARPGADARPSLRRQRRLRIEGTRNLMAAAQAAGARRVVAQSIAFIYAPGPAPRREDRSARSIAKPSASTIDGVLALEAQVLNTPGIDGVVLRYGRLYGPGTWFDGAGRPGPAHHATPRRTRRCSRSRAARPASTTSPRTTARFRSRRRGGSWASIRLPHARVTGRAHCARRAAASRVPVRQPRSVSRISVHASSCAGSGQALESRPRTCK